jgi:hypothetical protein
MAIQEQKRSMAVDKSAGAIRKHIKITGNIKGKNALLKSLIFDCFDEMVLARNKIKASLAKSEVWTVKPKTGILSHLRASLISTP